MTLFFFFFMLATIPTLAVLARLHSAPLESPDVVIAPARIFRYVGLPLSGAAFAVCFALALKRFRRDEHRPSAVGQL